MAEFCEVVGEAPAAPDGPPRLSEECEPPLGVVNGLNTNRNVAAPTSKISRTMDRRVRRFFIIRSGSSKSAITDFRDYSRITMESFRVGVVSLASLCYIEWPSRAGSVGR